MEDQLKLENQLCFPLYAASRQITGLYTPFLKELDLSYTQYIVMLVLWQNEQIRVTDLCRRLYLDTGTITPLLKKLENKGYLIRKRSMEDERVVMVCLTDEGRQLKKKAVSIPEKVSNCVSLQNDEAAALYGILYKILEGQKDEQG